MAVTFIFVAVCGLVNVLLSYRYIPGIPPLFELKQFRHENSPGDTDPPLALGFLVFNDKELFSIFFYNYAREALAIS